MRFFQLQFHAVDLAVYPSTLDYMLMYCHFMFFTVILTIAFLQHDARLAWCHCVCPYIHPSHGHKPVLYGDNWTNQAAFGMDASFHLSHTVL